MKVSKAIESLLLEFCGSPQQKSVRTLGTTTIIFGAVGWMFGLFHAHLAVIVIGIGVVFLLLGLLQITYNEA